MRRNFENDDGHTESGEKPPPPPRPCQACRRLTAHAILSQLGAKCYACYEDYCGATRPSPRLADKRVEGPVAWAYLLKQREFAGERISTTHKTMWRSALKHRDAPTEPA